MKVGWFRIVGGSIASLALALAGCAQPYEDPEYPHQPVGTDGAGAETEPVRTSASLEAIPPAPPADIAIGVDEQNYADTDPTALSEFRPTLDPYGTWSDDPNYGVVWQPSPAAVGADFTPYVSSGHWAYDEDWVWVSDYSWGWAPFHYGRWVTLGPRGWGWIPGRAYRGAWVTWRVGYGAYDYLGWAPMAPTWYWRGGYAVGLYAPPSPAYYYAPHRDVFSPVIASRIVPPGRVPAIAANTRPYFPSDPQFTGRTAAMPGVGGRAVAQPGLNHGPVPSSLGIPPQAIAHTTTADPGLNRARAFATPTTAVAAGARAPQGFARFDGPNNAGRAVSGPQVGDVRGPQMGASVGRPFVNGPTRLPDRGPLPTYSGPRAAAMPSTYARPSYMPQPNYARPSAVPQPTYARPMPPNFPSSSFHPSPQVSVPYRAPASPQYQAPVHQAPVFHPPSPSFQGGGGGGGGSHVGAAPHVGGARGGHR